MARLQSRTLAPLLLLALPVGAQEPPAPSAGHVVEAETRERWLHGRQKPAFTPPRESTDWIRIDSVLSGPGSGLRTFYLTVGRRGRGDPATLTVDAVGRPERLDAGLRPRRRSIHRTPEDSARSERRRLLRGFSTRLLALPGSKLWDLVPTFRPDRPDRPAVGASWVDTLDRVTERDGFRQAYRGRRVSTILRDTLVEGRRLWIVRDSAAVRYEERWLSEERTLDTLFTVERQAEGSIVGRYLYDPELRLYRARHDSTALAGTAVLRYPDGREFATPARYDRTRRIRLHDPAGYAAREAQDSAARADRRAGMLLLPPDVPQRSDRPGLEAGDTTSHIQTLRQRGVYDGFDADDVRFLLPFMADPGLAFAFGLSRDAFYENPRQTLLSHPPAITPDTASWPCTPEACRLLARQRDTAGEPRLRDLGLVARLVLEPARWADTVAARVEAGSNFLVPALQLVRGVAATWPAGSKAPLPGPDADWRAWLHWMNGPDPDHPSARTDTAAPPVRFDRGHGTAIRFREAVTGRDVAGQIHRKLETATTDSARLVYGAVLLGLGEHDPEPAAVAERFLSGSDADRTLAMRELRRLPLTPADSATAVELTDRLLAIVIEGAEPWPQLAPRPDGRRVGLHRITGGTKAGAPVLILSDSLPAAVRERWRGRATLLTAEEWEARSDRRAGILFNPATVRTAGPFARLYVGHTSRLERREDQAPGGYAGGVTAYLLRTAEGWKVVGVDVWVT